MQINLQGFFYPTKYLLLIKTATEGYLKSFQPSGSIPENPLAAANQAKTASLSKQLSQYPNGADAVGCIVMITDKSNQAVQ